MSDVQYGIAYDDGEIFEVFIVPGTKAAENPRAEAYAALAWARGQYFGEGYANFAGAHIVCRESEEDEWRPL